jgi:DNA primase
LDRREYIISKFPDNSPNADGEIHARCPFHNDSNPSFSINVDRGVFICRSSSCGVRGTFPLFYKLSENISSWREVWQKLKTESTDFNIDDLFDKKGKKYENRTIDFPDPSCLEEISFIQYLHERGIGKDVIDFYGLKFGKIGEFSGLDIYNTIVVPIWDIDGIYKTFQLRNLMNGTRWLNPVGSPIQKILYGGWAVDGSTDTLWIVEGASDVWKLKTFNQQAVSLGTKSASHAQILKVHTLSRLYKKTPIVFLDGDAKESASNLFMELTALGLQAKIVRDLEKHEDPGGMSPERFQEVLDAI